MRRVRVNRRANVEWRIIRERRITHLLTYFSPLRISMLNKPNIPNSFPPSWTWFDTNLTINYIHTNGWTCHSLSHSHSAHIARVHSDIFHARPNVFGHMNLTLMWCRSCTCLPNCQPLVRQTNICFSCSSIFVYHFRWLRCIIWPMVVRCSRIDNFYQTHYCDGWRIHGRAITISKFQ